MLSWDFKKQVMPSTVPYDALVVVGISLRTPVGNPSGGEVVVKCYLAGEEVHDAHTIALPPGAVEAMPDDLKKALDAWCQKILQDQQMVPGGAAPAPQPKPKPKPGEPAPPGFAPVLG